jgi:DNA-binding NarL/FixJ family response regulator
MKSITVLLSDDHAMVRDGLRLLLQATEDIQVVGEAENGHQAVAAAQRLRPDVVLLDLAMPLLNGVEATRQIRMTVPSAKVLILSCYRDDQHVHQAIEAGAAGYVLKAGGGTDLLSAIREVHRGNAFFSPLISKCLLERSRGTDSPSRAMSTAKLTPRQMEILQLIAEGYATKQIAALLSIAKKTVEMHREALMDRLEIRKIAALTRYAVSRGVVEVNYRPIGESQDPWRAK